MLTLLSGFIPKHLREERRSFRISAAWLEEYKSALSRVLLLACNLLFSCGASSSALAPNWLGFKAETREADDVRMACASELDVALLYREMGIKQLIDQWGNPLRISNKEIRTPYYTMVRGVPTNLSTWLIGRLLHYKTNDEPHQYSFPVFDHSEPNILLAKEEKGGPLREPA